jgi:hypothetical protein
MGDLPLPGNIPFHLSVLSTGSSAIAVKHAEFEGRLGTPTSEPKLIRNPFPVSLGDGPAVFRLFENGAVYWSDSTGAHALFGAIFLGWADEGSENSPLGLPTSDVMTASDGVGTVARFQQGSYAGLPGMNSNSVWGEIHTKWAALGGESGFLGYPVSDVVPGRAGVGAISKFQGGTITWHPDTGAVVVHGKILERWIVLGQELSYLGFPAADEAPSELGASRVSRFQNGEILLRNDGVLADIPETITFSVGPIVTDETLGGSVKVVVSSRGHFSYSGHMHNSGFIKLHFTAAVALHGNGQAFVLPAHEGSAEGHNPLSGDNTTNAWDKLGEDRRLRENWQTIKSCAVKVRVDIATDVAEVIGLLLTGIVVVGVPLFFASGPTKSKACPDGSAIFWHEGTPEPDCRTMF